jgi:hypothetical protein
MFYFGAGKFQYSGHPIYHIVQGAGYGAALAGGDKEIIVVSFYRGQVGRSLHKVGNVARRLD